jgi:hypothetical protein
MLARKLLAVIAALSVAGALTACGGSSGVSADTYAKSYCNVLRTFVHDLQVRTAALNSNTIKTAAQTKSAIRSFLSAVAADTDKAISRLRATGAPNFKDGDRVAAAIINAFTQIKNAIVTASNQANSLPTNSRGALRRAVQALGTSISTSVRGITSPNSPELAAAIARSPSCSRVTTG